MDYLPLSLSSFSALVVVFAVLIWLLQIEAFAYAYHRLGLRTGAVILILGGCLVGSYFNVPVASLPGRQVVSGRVVDYFGVGYVIPVVVDWPGTVIAVNVGGAIIPVAVSVYLFLRHHLWLSAPIATIGVAAVTHAIAHPVPGLGIALPIFAPAIAAAVIAMVLSRRRAAPVAYICGSVGTLIGADLLNLEKLQQLSAPVASIGGAGTFDGVFLTGILAVLIAALVRGPDDRPPRPEPGGPAQPA
ncbi:MAG: DUF1614 domain-containing protein [Acetobacteraceae bacterium]